MTEAAFEKTNLGWQIQQTQQRVGEWLEFQLSQLEAKLPEGTQLNGFDTPWLNFMLQLGFWIIVGALAIWLALRLIRMGPFLWENLAGFLQNRATPPAPTTSDRSVAEWLGRSQKWQQQGNYREACLCLYLAMLQRLNDTGLAPHQLSRTDGEYRAVIRTATKAEAYQTLITTHEQLLFGHGEASPEMFQACFRAFREVESL